jgi:hypothetical protein
MYGRQIYADHQLIIDGLIISGVTSFNSDFEAPFDSIDVLGNNLVTEVRTNSERNLSFSRFLMHADPLKFLTGDISCNGFLKYNNLTYGFNSGYLTNYNVSCGIGDLVNVTTDFIVYGNIGGGISQQILPNQNLDYVYVPNFGTIDLNANEGSTNRIVSFDYTISCERVPLFLLGSNNASSVFLKKPVSIDLSINIDIDDYQSTTIQNLICSQSLQNLTISLKNCNKTQTIETFSAPNAKLVSNSYQIDIDNPSTVELGFKSFLM